MKSVIVLGMMMLAAQDSHAFGSRRSSSTPAPTPQPPVVVNPPANDDQGTGGLKVVIQSAKYYDEDGYALLERARSLLERVVNSEEFKQRVIHHPYNGKETYVDNNGLTNVQIYN